MRPDLQSLYITEEELKQFTGMSERDLKAYKELKYAFIPRLLKISTYTEQILFFGWGLIPMAYLLKWSLFRKRLKKIWRDLDNYNAILKAIDISDRLEAAGNAKAGLTDREKAIFALKLTREDIVCALKTERIMRENKQFISRNPEMFATNLPALETLQIRNEAHAQGRLLNEALQVALGVQAEMKKLQDGR